MKKLLAFVLAFSMLLCACGAKNAGAMRTESIAEEFYEMSDAAAPMQSAMKNDAAPNLPAGRKWIITASVDVETDDMEKTLPVIVSEVGTLGGYIENQDSYNGSVYNGRRYRHANLTVRIPVERLDEFEEGLSECANVVSQSRNASDVTLTYVDTQTRLEALRTEQGRLLELLAKAENMSDLLQIESRLTDVNYELERVASQLRSLDNRIDYATVNVSVSEVTEYTPAEKPGFVQRIAKGFVDNLKALWEMLQDIAVFVITNIPAICLWCAVIFGLVKLAKKLHLHRKLRKPKE